MSKGISVNIIMLLVTAAVAMGVTVLTFQHTTNSLSWTMMDNPSSYNCTVDTISSVTGILPMVFGVAVVMIVLAVVMTWLYLPMEQLEENKYAKWFIGSIYYFVYGLLGMVCFTPPFLLGYFMYDFIFVQGNTGSVTFIGQTLVFVVGAYFAIAAFGYFFKHIIYDRFAKKYSELHPYEETEEEKPTN